MQDAIVNPDLIAMYARCEDAPGDTALYAAISDELQSLGYAKLAHAFRWMCKRGVYPHKREAYCNRYFVKGRRVPNKYRWAWYVEPPATYRQSPVAGVLPKSAWSNHALPPLLLHANQKVCGSHQECVMFLADRLARLADAYCVDAPQNHELKLAAARPDGTPLAEMPAIPEEGAA